MPEEWALSYLVSWESICKQHRWYGIKGCCPAAPCTDLSLVGFPSKYIANFKGCISDSDKISPPVDRRGESGLKSVAERRAHKVTQRYSYGALPMWLISYICVLPWSLSVPDRPQYLRLRSGVWVCRSITAAMNRVLLTEEERTDKTSHQHCLILNYCQNYNYCTWRIHRTCKRPVVFWSVLFPSLRYQTLLTYSSVLMAVFIPLISFVIQVWHSHWHFWSSMESKGRRKKD